VGHLDHPVGQWLDGSPTLLACWATEAGRPVLHNSQNLCMNAATLLYRIIKRTPHRRWSKLFTSFAGIPKRRQRMLPYPHDAGHHCGIKLDQKFRLPENGDIDQIKAGMRS